MSLLKDGDTFRFNIWKRLQSDLKYVVTEISAVMCSRALKIRQYISTLKICASSNVTNDSFLVN